MASNIALMPDIQTRLPMSQGALARGISPAQWRVLVETTFPSAKSPEAIEMAFDYCAARGLDVFKKPVHIVPMWNSAKREYVETVWPGINEIQITAARTGVWAGMDSPKWGPMVTRTFVGERNRQRAEIAVTFPEWCEVTVYRLVGGAPRPFCEPVYWVEAYSTSGGKNSELPTDMWIKRPRGQLHKVAKAASLRAAFPEEGELTAEEMEGKEIEGGGGVIVARTPAAIRAPAVGSDVVEDDAVEPVAISQDDIEKFVADTQEKLSAIDSLDKLDAFWFSKVNPRVREIGEIDTSAGPRLIALFKRHKAKLTRLADEVVVTEPSATSAPAPANDPIVAAAVEDFDLPAELVIDIRNFSNPDAPGVPNWPEWGKACIKAVKSIDTELVLDKWVARHDKTLNFIDKLTVIGKFANGDDMTGPALADMIALWVRRQYAKINGATLAMRWADGKETNFHADVEDWADGLESMAKSPATFHNVFANREQAEALIKARDGAPVAARLQATLDKADALEAARRAEREAA